MAIPILAKILAGIVAWKGADAGIDALTGTPEKALAKKEGQAAREQRKALFSELLTEAPKQRLQSRKSKRNLSQEDLDQFMALLGSMPMDTGASDPAGEAGALEAAISQATGIPNFGDRIRSGAAPNLSKYPMLAAYGHRLNLETL